MRNVTYTVRPEDVFRRFALISNYMEYVAIPDHDRLLEAMAEYEESLLRCAEHGIGAAGGAAAAPTATGSAVGTAAGTATASAAESGQETHAHSIAA